jgi:hypothetical protein
MASQIQYRRGTNAQNIAFTGALAEITVDTTNGTLRVHDGFTPGGSNVATVSYVTAQISALSANSITNGTSSVAVIASGGNIRANVGGNTITNTFSDGLAVTGNISATSNIIIGPGANTRIHMFGDAFHIDNISPTGNIVLVGNSLSESSFEALKVLATGGVAFTGNLVPISAVNGAFGNLIGNIGSSTQRFAGVYANTVFATATSAQYADLAEMYVSDSNYAPGTVVEFGGEYEITISSASHSTAVAGIVSTNPSYLMNSEQPGEHVLAVALTGRVPCQVQGPVRKGDVLVASATPGVAQRIGMNWQPGCILGKSMQVIESAEIRTIEVAVGRT